MQFYSEPERESDPYALPDVEIFQLTAMEVLTETAQYEDEIYEYLKRHEFRLATMNSRTADAMYDRMIEELRITGGWFYQYCFPGCLPDSAPNGPYVTADEAKQACRDECEA